MAKDGRPSWFKFDTALCRLILQIDRKSIGDAVWHAAQFFLNGAVPDELDSEACIVFNILAENINDAFSAYTRQVESGRVGGLKRSENSAKKNKHP